MSRSSGMAQPFLGSRTGTSGRGAGEKKTRVVEGASASQAGSAARATSRRAAAPEESVTTMSKVSAEWTSKWPTSTTGAPDSGVARRGALGPVSERSASSNPM